MTDLPMGDIPWWHAGRRGSAVAVTHGAEQATWLELAEGASRRARALRDLGVGQHDVVSIALPNGRDFVESVFGAWMTGASVNPLSSRLPMPEMRGLLELARPKVVIGAEPSELRGWHVLPAEWRPAGNGDHFPSQVAAHWKMMCSGGSTGRPKLIVDARPATADPATHPLCEGGEVLVAPGATFMNTGPLYHNGPFAHAFWSLFSGAELVGQVRFDAEDTLRQIARRSVKHIYMVPTMMARIWALPEAVRAAYDLSGLQSLIHTAAPCPEWLKRRWLEWLGPDRIWEAYGSTESPGATWINGVDWLCRPGSVGQFKMGSRGRILGPDGAELPPGEIGEIYMMPRRGAGSTYSYVGSEPRRKGGWETTGDLGWMDGDGYLYLADRRADLIIRGGSNVYPAEVEAVISEHPLVASCAVIGLPHPDLGAKVHAIVEPREDGLTPEALQRFTRDRLSGYKVPESWEFVSEPLRDAAGKVRRGALREERLMKSPHPA
jgi:bile acid-coenzyme A ligase